MRTRLLALLLLTAGVSPASFSQGMGFMDSNNVPCGPAGSNSCKNQYSMPYMGGPNKALYNGVASDWVYCDAYIYGLGGVGGSQVPSAECYAWNSGTVANWNASTTRYERGAPYGVYGGLLAAHLPAGTYKIKFYWYPGSNLAWPGSSDYIFTFYPEVNSLDITVKDQNGAVIPNAQIEPKQISASNITQAMGEYLACSVVTTGSTGKARFNWVPASQTIRLRVYYGVSQVSAPIDIQLPPDPACPNPSSNRVVLVVTTTGTGLHPITLGNGTTVDPGSVVGGPGIFTDKTDAGNWITDLFVPPSHSVENWHTFIQSIASWGPFGLLTSFAATFSQAAYSGVDTRMWVVAFPGVVGMTIDLRPTAQGGGVLGDFLGQFRATLGWFTWGLWIAMLFRWFKPKVGF